MQTLKRSLTRALALAVGLSGGFATAASPDHLLSVVTSASGPSQAMALILTRQYVQRGGTAQVLLCDSAAELALADGEAGRTIYKPAPVSPRGMLSGLMEAGVRVEVCAIFLPNREEGPDDLTDGIGVARPDAIAERMADPGTRLFTN